MYSPVFSSRPTTSGSPPVLSISWSDHSFSPLASSFACTLGHSRPLWRFMFVSKRPFNAPSSSLRCPGDNSFLLLFNGSRIVCHSLALRLLGRLRRPVWRFDAELLGVLGVQSLPAAEFHGFRANHAADGSSAEKVVQNIETNVPPGSAYGDVGPANVGPQRQASAASKGFEFPSHVEAAPLV